MAWIRRMLRDTKVFVKARKDGSPDVGRDGRVDIKYKLDEGAKVYRAALKNLAHSGEEEDDALLPAREIRGRWGSAS